MINLFSDKGVIELTPPNFDFDGVTIEAWQVIVGLVIALCVIAIPIVVISLIRYKGTGEKFAFNTRDIAYGAICLAMSYALSFVGLRFPLGGTITLASILPISIYCYYFGLRKGAIICAVFMLLQLTQGPYIILFGYFGSSL